MSRFFSLILLLCVAAPLVAGESDRLREEVKRLVGELDSNRFEIRQHAAERLESLTAKPESSQLLADEFRRELLRPDISFEVRWRLTRWSRRLPAVTLEPAGDVPPEELDRLVRQLDDDSYAVRLGAAQRVEWLANNPKLVCPLMILLKQRLADAALSVEARQQLDATWQRVRGAWLLLGSTGCELPAVSDEQINQWLDDLTRPAPAAEEPTRGMAHSTANRELLDLLARDAYVPRVKAAILSRLAQDVDTGAAVRLNALLDWTKPAMVAEYWQGRRQLGEQHLLVNVPTLSPGAMRPTHFDRVDDRVAHYVTGNSLTPGDYPVGVAFPHPKREEGFFHLVNLPTPHRRMAYAHFVQTDSVKRLAALSRRTFDRILAEKHPMTEPELVMLEQLDPAEMSRFAGKYFMLIEDGMLPNSTLHRLGGRPSRFGMVCVRLAAEGTKDALPGLTDAITKKAFLPPTPLAPYRLHWLAALSIASRDPWPEVDAWLADQIDKTEPLIEGRGSGPELGATAAAVLMGRHGRTAAQFELQPATDALMAKLHISGYRFGNEATQKKVRQWWEEERKKIAPQR